MFKSAVVLLLVVLLAGTGSAWQNQSETQTKPADEPGRFVSPAELNVRIEADVRTFVVMAALNIAGYDYEMGGPLSPVRQELRKDLTKVNPQLKSALADFVKAHRRAGADEASDASRYAALSLLMTQPPSFSIYQRDENTIPEDLRPLVDERFLNLIRQFYTSSGIKELIPKYMEVGKAFSTAYRRPVGGMIYDILEYLHARPQPTIDMRPLVISSGSEQRAGTAKQSVVARTRTRHVFVIPELLIPAGSAFVRDDLLNQKEELIYRRVGDDYIVVVGPSRTFHSEAVRRALIRFMIDPIIERRLRTSLEYKDAIVNLVSSVPTAQKPFGSSVYLVIRESLAVATEARMRVIEAKQTRSNYNEEDAVFDLAQAYLRGAVLVFHFYEALQGLEKVGISIEDFYDQMLATTKFDREAMRAKEFEPIVAKVSARRASTAKSESREATAAAAMANTIAGKILLSDDLIRQRRFGDAQSILSEILKLEPKNARALYGMAQVVSQVPSGPEADPNAEENDKIQAQHERLEQAIKLYRGAIENASSSEKWLTQWCHVLVGRILDFQDFRTDAILEYEKAIALGVLENGAYKEAVEGKQRPYGHK
jgi:tetratricopeptide (TPR) repeat protein